MPAKKQTRVKNAGALTDAEKFWFFFFMRYNQKPYRLWDIHGARRYLYALMLMGYAWWEDVLPKDEETLFSFYVNPKPLDSRPPSDTVSNILEYEEADLEFICKKLKRPHWASKRSYYSGRITIAETRKDWSHDLERIRKSAQLEKRIPTLAGRKKCKIPIY